MTLLQFRGSLSTNEWLKRERQEACQHAFPKGRSAFMGGTIFSRRYDPEHDDYKSGPTYRRVCMLCDLVIDIAVPSPELKPLITLNAPSQNWMRAHGFVGWKIDEMEIGHEEAVQDRYQKDQLVRAQTRAQRR